MFFPTIATLLFLLASTAQGFVTKSAPTTTSSLELPSISPSPGVYTTGYLGDPDTITLYYVSLDGSMKYRTASKSSGYHYTWDDVRNMGGKFTAHTPAVIDYKGNPFVCGIADKTKNALCAIYDESQGAFKDWVNIGGNCQNSPAVGYLSQRNEIVLVIRGGAGAMWYSIGLPGSKFSGYKSLGGKFYGAPQVAILGSGDKEILMMVAFGTNNYIYYQVYSEGKWGTRTKTAFVASKGWQSMNLIPSDYDSGSGLYKSLTLIARSKDGIASYATYSRERDWSNLLDFGYEVPASFTPCEARNGTLIYYANKDKVLFTSSFGSSICGNRYNN